MTEKLRVANRIEQEQTTPPADRKMLLQQVVDQVRRDSTEQNEAYLRETTVPYGGE